MSSKWFLHKWKFTCKVLYKWLGDKKKSCWENIANIEANAIYEKKLAKQGVHVCECICKFKHDCVTNQRVETDIKTFSLSAIFTVHCHIIVNIL